jgi:hypothetical protein
MFFPDARRVFAVCSVISVSFRFAVGSVAQIIDTDLRALAQGGVTS